MSCARTLVSTGISSRRGRFRAAMSTATPVTNIASVESMNGAPRIAPTPIPCDADDPPPVRIAMIGIIVSGSAVPTAARTEPTAPSASSSFRPNHSIPFVNSSAPKRITRNAPTRTRKSISALEAADEGNARRDDGEDQGGHRDHGTFAAAPVPDEGRDDARRGRRDNGREPEPEETFRPDGEEIRDQPGDVELRRARERRDAGDRHQDDAAGQKDDRKVGPEAEEPGDRLLEAARIRLLRAS